MESCRLQNFSITVDKQGAEQYTKVTYPIRYGRFCEIKTPDYLFQFNLNGEIKFIRGFTRNWPHPAEWLKRTDADDWVFYTVGAYNGIFSYLGEHYLPCLSYSSNSLWNYNPFSDSNIQKALKAWSRLRENLCGIPIAGIPSRIKDFMTLIIQNDKNSLRLKSKKLHRIIGGRVSVLPPDSRHVDYEVIPLMIADGCLYHCGFCRIKSQQRFRTRSRENVVEQIRQLQAFYGANLGNYNALFLGNHDALAAESDHICMAATRAYEAFGFGRSHVKPSTLFVFGSVDSLLNTGNGLFDALNRMPMYTYINIGFESVDAATLLRINKPLEVSKIEDAFQKMLDVNRNFPNIEITANFLLDDAFPPEHYRSLVELIRSRLDRFYSKGAIYLSPLDTSRDKRALLHRVVEIKKMSRLPTFIYLIQRL
jgi:hypothetical protein